MSVFRNIKARYDMFGLQGLLLSVKSRIVRRQICVNIWRPGLPYALQLRLRTTDISLFRDILLNDEYSWRPSITPSIIVDAGANVGLTSVSFAEKYPEAQIFALEPEPSNFELLARNTAHYPNIIPVCGALWKDNVTLDIVDPGQGHWGFQTLEPVTVGMDGRWTLGMTIDGLMREYTIPYIDILKMDIEGAEKEVFEDPSRWIDRVGVIMVELHDRLKPGCSESVYSATEGFQCRWTRGETTVFARAEYAAGGQGDGFAEKAARENSKNGDKQRRHFKIREVSTRVGTA